MTITIHTLMDDFGQMVDQVRVTLDKPAPALKPADFTCKDCYKDLGATVAIPGVKALSVMGKEIVLDFEPFLYRIDFAIACKKLDLTVTKANAQTKNYLCRSDQRQRLRSQTLLLLP